MCQLIFAGGRNYQVRDFLAPDNSTWYGRDPFLGERFRGGSLAKTFRLLARVFGWILKVDDGTAAAFSRLFMVK